MVRLSSETPRDDLGFRFRAPHPSWCLAVRCPRDNPKCSNCHKFLGSLHRLRNGEDSQSNDRVQGRVDEQGASSGNDSGTCKRRDHMVFSCVFCRSL